MKGIYLRQINTTNVLCIHNKILFREIIFHVKTEEIDFGHNPVDSMSSYKLVTDQLGHSTD